MERVSMDGFNLVGLKLDHKTTNEGGRSGIDCGTLWQKFEAEHAAEKIPGKLGEEVYAVYFGYEGDHTKPFSYFIGCRVKTGAIAPEGMHSLSIPGGNYFKITAKGQMPGCVAGAWRSIWTSAAARSYQYDFEMYDERSKDWSDAEVEIFVGS